jgi:galactokinase
MVDVETVFKQQFGCPPAHVVQAPGRLELLGNHTDYNQGLVMALAIDKYIAMASAPRTDGRIELASSAFPQRESFFAIQLEKNPAAPWADYTKGVLVQLNRRGAPFRGFNAAIHATLPIGAGLSSSAALEVATALTVRQLYPYSLTETGLSEPPRKDARGKVSTPLTAAQKLLIAKLCQAAENQFVGVNCGLLDQISCLFGKASHVIQIDCRDLTVNLTSLIGEVEIMVCNSGVKHALVGGEYNELRRQCEAAAQALGVKSLRQVDPSMLNTHKAKLTQRQYECAYHIVGENQRVVFGERALLANDLEQFGQYLFQSHASSRDYFHNSCPELDLLVELARVQRGCLGARLSGGGFGGATINLVQSAQAAEFSQAMAAQYQQRTGHALEPMVCRIVDGAQST